MPIGYVGGKSAKTKFLLQNSPEEKSYKNLVLNCSGVGWFYLKEDFSHCDRIVFNDINPYLINLLKAFSNPEIFLEVFEKYMLPGKDLALDGCETLQQATSRFKDLYNLWRVELHSRQISLNEIDYKAAVQYSFLLSHSFAGRHPLRAGFNFRDGDPLYPNFMKVLNLLKKRKYADLLKKVEFESMDLVDCFEKYDSKETFFYVDPPYYCKESDYNVDNEIYGTIGHIRLAQAARRVKGKLMISYFDFPYLKHFYPDYLFNKATEEFHKPSCNFKSKSSSEREILIINYPFNGFIQKYTPDENFGNEDYFKIAEHLAPKPGKRTRSSYSNEFKKVIVDLINLGVKKKMLIKVFNIGSYTSINRWVKRILKEETMILKAA
jgi:DNA adenine methylase